MCSINSMLYKKEEAMKNAVNERKAFLEEYEKHTVLVKGTKKNKVATYRVGVTDCIRNFKSNNILIKYQSTEGVINIFEDTIYKIRNEKNENMIEDIERDILKRCGHINGDNHHLIRYENKLNVYILRLNIDGCSVFKGNIKIRELDFSVQMEEDEDNTVKIFNSIKLGDIIAGEGGRIDNKSYDTLWYFTDDSKEIAHKVLELNRDYFKKNGLFGKYCTSKLLEVKDF